MTRANHANGVAQGGGRRVLALLLLLGATSFVASGCHDEERLRQRLEGQPVARLPVEPDQPDTPPAPALLDTVRDWRQPERYASSVTADWPLVTAPAGDDYEITYRVPVSWLIDERPGRASNSPATVSARASRTQLDDSELSLATYAAQLAEGNPLFQYSTLDGHVVYVTRREIALAPTDPDARREVFHTAAVSVDGNIAKLDVRYASELDWRFDQLGAAITGTLQVRRRD